VIRYTLGWLGVGAVVAVLVIAALGGNDAADDVALPPIDDIELSDAAREGGCRLVRAARGTPPLNPPVDGRPAPSATTPGVYDRPPRRDALTAAIRRGVVVIDYRSGLGDAERDELRTLQEALPEATVVTPNDTAMPFEIAATAYRRLLGCRRFNAEALEAIRLFQGRYLGSGPDRAP
jgi:hypothetical protein